MKAFNRVNSHGRQYYFTELIDGATEIRTNGKAIVVAHPIDRLNQSWYDWTVGHLFIQHAFDYLTADEREFLQTGITAEEWAIMFPPLKNEL